MKGVGARYPAYDAARKGPVDLEQRINICRTDHQKAMPFKFESKELLALATYVGRQSRGMQIENSDERLKPFIEAGRKLFTQRQGQINLSCAQCHDDNWGKHLASSLIPQGHPTGYPIYRLEWQSLGSLQRRLRNCMIGMRAEPYGYGAPENVNMEVFLMWRARTKTRNPRGAAVSAIALRIYASLVRRWLCVPRTSSVLISRRNHLTSAHHDRATMFCAGRISLAIQVEEPA